MTVAKKEDFTPSALLVDDAVLLVDFGGAGMSTIFLLWIYKNCIIFRFCLALDLPLRLIDYEGSFVANERFSTLGKSMIRGTFTLRQSLQTLDYKLTSFIFIRNSPVYSDL